MSVWARLRRYLTINPEEPHSRKSKQHAQRYGKYLWFKTTRELIKHHASIVFTGHDKHGLCLVRSCMKGQGTGQWTWCLKKEVVLTIESCINESNMLPFGTLFRNLCSTLMKKHSS